MIDLHTVGANIALRRQERGLTQRELAKLLRICPQAVSKWECCRAFPDVCYLDELALHLRCSIDDLLTGKHSETKKGA